MTSLVIVLVVTTLVFLAVPTTRSLGAASAVALFALYPFHFAALLVLGLVAVALFNHYRRKRNV